MDEKLIQGAHKIHFGNRTDGLVTGVKDVLSFDANEVLLETEQGILMIKGSNLHVTRLTVEKGEVEIDGKVDSFTYSDMGSGRKNGESLLGRLFK